MLFTRCPNCQTTFKITADTLRVARGAVRCGHCATVYSAFSGLRQDSLDPGMQRDEDYLSPTLQTQELASIEDIESPELDQSPAASDPTADPAASRDDAAATAPPPPATSPDEGPAASVGDTQSGASAAPVSGVGADDAPRTAEAMDASEDPVPSARTAADAPHEPPTSAASGSLQFEMPVDDEWSQLLKEIEETSSDELEAEAASSDEARDHRDDADDLASADTDEDGGRPDFFDIGEPGARGQWGEAASSRDDRDSGRALAMAHDTAAAGAVREESTLDEDSDVASAQTEAPISAEQIDATLSAAPDVHMMAALEADLGAPRANGEPRRMWRTGAAVMALLLVAQLVHHNRALLATQPVVGTLVQRTYALLGAPLAPTWDLEQYEITNWAATAGETDSGVGNLRITAHVRNGGPAPQPYPSLQLELKDRWEAVIGRRVFSPREYLGTEFDTDTLMGSGETVPAELAVVDPGLDASGFELDVCLASGNETYRCSADRVFQQ